MRLFAPDLRRMVTAAVVTVAIVAIVAAAALIGLTRALHVVSTRSTRAVESVRIAEAMQRNVLLHDHVADRAARAQIGERLREQVARAQALLMTKEERVALDSAERAVSAYLATDAAAGPDSRASAKHAAAFAELEKLVVIEQGVADDAAATMRRYDADADVIGASIAAGIVVAAALMVRWLDTRALRPLLELTRKMRSFGHGNLDERAKEEGPAEVTEMARRFNEMAAAIARQRKERQTFIAGVVHDLKNPLSVLRLSADVGCRQESETPPQQVKKVLALVSRQVERLDRMVGDLLDSVSIETGNFRLKLEDHDARTIATEIAELYAAASRAHTIELDIPTAAVPLRCDAMRVEQVLSNLVSNAIKYSPEGGRVSLQVQPSEGGEVTFVVRDEGVGMNEEDAAKAFDPFRRSVQLRDSVAGSGLGLFVVRRLVEAHGGHIHVNTEPGTGSSFEVRIPATAS